MKKIFTLLLILATTTLFAQTVPVELSSFQARVYDWGIYITWTAESEVGFDYYELEHKGSMYDWEAIATIEPKINMSYSVAQLGSTFDGDNYYRLKMVDEDGSYEYSDIVHAYYEKFGGDINIYPNPANDHIAFYSSNENTAYIQCYTMTGKLALSGTFNCRRFDISSLPLGQYIIVITAGPLKETEILIKQ